MYKPDRWVVFKITHNDETFYKVFGMWYNTYTAGDSWKLNSGIIKVEEVNDQYHFHGNSGSIYVGYKNSYGLTNYGANIASSFLSSGKAMIMPEHTNWLELQYN